MIDRQLKDEISNVHTAARTALTKINQALDKNASERAELEQHKAELMALTERLEKVGETPTAVVNGVREAA